MKAQRFSRGQRVFVLPHEGSHDFGQLAATVCDGDTPYGRDFVTVRTDGSAPFSVPRDVLVAVEPEQPVAPPIGDQLRRAAVGIATLVAVFGALYWLAGPGPARAQDASALAFYRQDTAAPTQKRPRLTKPAPGDVEETGRWVNIPLPPPPPYVRGRFTCAVNVNRYLARLGKPTTGSALAHSFLRWGRPSGPRPGAVQVERRRGGGHVKIVSHHDGARWMCLNPSARRQDWHLTPCGGRAMAWRAA